jgi:hypothetical protein
VNDVPVSASADSGRDRKRASAQVAKNDSSAKSDKAKPLLQAVSFFGMRDTETKKR